MRHKCLKSVSSEVTRNYMDLHSKVAKLYQNTTMWYKSEVVRPVSLTQLNHELNQRLREHLSQMSQSESALFKGGDSPIKPLITDSCNAKKKVSQHIRVFLSEKVKVPTHRRKTDSP